MEQPVFLFFFLILKGAASLGVREKSPHDVNSDVALQGARMLIGQQAPLMSVRANIY